MPLVLTEGPAAEPVALDELKSLTRIDGSEEDTLLASLLVAARIHIEQTFGLALINQEWSCFLSKWPASHELRISRGPVRSVSALRVYDARCAVTTIDAADYYAVASPHSIRIERRSGVDWPSPGRRVNGVEIAFTAGFGAEGRDVPEPIRQAILALAAWWFDEQTPTTGQKVTAPPAVLALMSPYREFRL